MCSTDELGRRGVQRRTRPERTRRADRPRWARWSLVGLAGLALLISGCGASTFSAHDLEVRTTGDTVYLMARNTGVSRNLCAGLGGDVARAEAQSAATDGPTIQLARVGGCYTVRHVIVCSDGDAACLTHEERHRREGAFHP
jgi:hypothetical protein